MTKKTNLRIKELTEEISNLKHHASMLEKECERLKKITLYLEVRIFSIFKYNKMQLAE